jgi:dTDP-4-dehydrorhamnose 3,5-epimerase
VPFTFQKLAIPDVILVQPRVFTDDRGSFLETYKQSEFAAHGIDLPFVQDNHSCSDPGVLRGLHYQVPPFVQGKLVRCVFGEILDVAVDIRKGSPTFGQWVAEVLTQDNRKMLYVPPGFAHGYYAMNRKVEVCYKVTAEYAPRCERGILWNDPEIGVQWPSTEVRLSGQDQAHPTLARAELFS